MEQSLATDMIQKQLRFFGFVRPIVNLIREGALHLPRIGMTIKNLGISY